MTAAEIRDRFYMQMALELAARGIGYTSPNPLVGAVVVREGRVVGRGYHARFGQAHAEVNALDEAGDRARGATLYVTLEPCNHTGKTPPCTEKILASGIRRVVVAMPDPNPGVTGGGNARLRAAGIEVAEGIAEAAARCQNEFFIKHTRTGRPFVILKSAATLDGRIATRTGDAHWVSGPEARQFVHTLRHAVDAILVGAATIKADDPRLTTRLPQGDGRDPVRIILDTRLSIPLNARVLTQTSAAATMLAIGPDVPADTRRRAESAGARILTTPCRDGRIDIAQLMATLGGQGIASVLVEGGSHVAGSFLRDGLVDKVVFFIAPKLLGGDDGVPVSRGPGQERMRDCLPLERIAVHRFGEDIMIEGYPDHTTAPR